MPRPVLVRADMVLQIKLSASNFKDDTNERTSQGERARPGGLRVKTGRHKTRGACARAGRVRRYVPTTGSAPGGLAVVNKAPLDSIRGL